MDLSTVVNTEALYSLELIHPDTEKPFGVTWDIRSASSAEAKAVARKNLDKRLERQQKQKFVKADMAITAEIEQLAACVASWEWGLDPNGEQNMWQGEIPEHTFKKVCEILKTDWIFSQVYEAANKVGNFTQS